MPPKKQKKKAVHYQLSDSLSKYRASSSTPFALSIDSQQLPEPFLPTPEPTPSTNMASDTTSPASIISRDELNATPGPSTPIMVVPPSMASPRTSRIPPSQGRPWTPPSMFTTEQDTTQSGGRPGLGDYVKNRRELLEILEALHSTGIQNQLDLPQIVVVGSQSVGKSSLIESMSGITLPRDTGTCTRCPMECRLQHAAVWSCQIVLRFEYDEYGRRLPAMKEEPFGPTIHRSSDVEIILRRAQRAILRQSITPSVFLNDADLSVDGPPSQSFSKNCVCVRVAGPNVPDLFFYDLPGIITSVSDGGSYEDIKLVEELALSYIQKKNSIVLLCISCETDFENQRAGHIVLRNPGVRQRTVGVLTKVDRIEPGSGPAHKWLRLLQGRENVLPQGWFCVKQPDLEQLQSGITWEEARLGEQEFFAMTSPWDALEGAHRNRLGRDALAEHLGTILSRLVSRELPSIRKKVLGELDDVKAKLFDLTPPHHDNPQREVITLLRDFNKKVSKHIEGIPPRITKTMTTVPATASGLLHELHGAYDRFREKVWKTTPDLRPWDSGLNPNQNLEKQMLDDLAKDDKAVRVTKGPQFFVDEVMELAKDSRTRELPGNYPFSVKESLIAESTGLWNDLAIDCFDEVKTIIDSHLGNLIDEHFNDYNHGGLKAAVSRTTKKVLVKLAKETALKIDGLCASEAAPYTQSEEAFLDYRARLLQRYIMVNNQSLGNPNVVQILQQYNPSGYNYTNMNSTHWSYINTAISQLQALGISPLTAQDFIKLVHTSNVNPGLEIMAEIRAYFEVAFKRFTDNIPKQIDTDFIRETDRELDLAMRSDVDLSERSCRRYLQEPDEIIRRREDFEGKKFQLESASQRLTEYYRGQQTGNSFAYSAWETSTEAANPEPEAEPDI